MKLFSSPHALSAAEQSRRQGRCVPQWEIAGAPPLLMEHISPGTSVAALKRDDEYVRV